MLTVYSKDSPTYIDSLGVKHYLATIKWRGNIVSAWLYDIDNNLAGVQKTYTRYSNTFIKDVLSYFEHHNLTHTVNQ